MIRYRPTLIAALVGVLLAAFALRLPELGRQSLWYDESVSLVLAAKPLGALFAHTARDIHPPLYYALLHFWIALMGASEFSAAFFSLWWGVLLVASGATLARWLGGNAVALLTTALVALSPFNVWYSQEVRMYTMGATLGLWTLLALWALLRGRRMKKRWVALWLFSAAAGLYTLYYFAFLLLAEALIVALWLGRSAGLRLRARRWVGLAAALVALYLPWIGTAWRQATEPPVPPWRGALPLAQMLSESLGALALGQSAEPQRFAPLLALLAVTMAGGLWLHSRQKGTAALAFLLLALGVPFAILLLSALTPLPLYHARYLFPYAPTFYVLVAMAFVGWARLARGLGGERGQAAAAMVLLTPLLLLSSESLQRLWHDPAFAADDLRGGVRLVEARWRADDLLLANAGYSYTAFQHYFEDPIGWQGRLPLWPGTAEPWALPLLQSGSLGGKASLGWGLPESDFYATDRAQTLAALEQVKANSARLWHFRLYDTVTDPDGEIRRWLDANALLFEDQLLTGESNARVQGWYFPPAADAHPQRPMTTHFLAPDGSQPWLTLHGTELPGGFFSSGGSWVDVGLWLEGSAAMEPTLHLSAGLYDTSPAARQWALTDEQPFGPLLSLQALPGLQRWPIRLRLPQGLPPGKYEVRLKFYRPSDGVVLAGTGDRMVNDQQVVAAVIEVGPTPPGIAASNVGTPLSARFGPLELLGYTLPDGPWEPGASVPVELLWRLREAVADEEPLRPFLTADILQGDDGGVTAPDQYPPTQWQVGELVRDIHYVTVAPDAAPGRYPLFLRATRGATAIPWRQGLFRRGERLPLGTLTVTDRARSFEPPALATPLDVLFSESIQLIGATLPDRPYTPGEALPLTLHWHALTRPSGRYKLFAHLMGPDGNLSAQRDLEPGDGSLPTNGWARGEYITTALTIPLPVELPPGSYTLRVGFYDPATGERALPSGPGVNVADRFLLLGPVELAPP